MRNLEEIARTIQAELDERDTLREIAIKSSRAIIRMSGTIIHLVHKNEDPLPMMREALDEVDRLRSLLDDHPILWNTGPVGDAMQEMAEAAIMLAIINDEQFPGPEELGIPARSWVMGLADVVGELRRLSLERLREGDVEAPERYLDIMEEIFLVLMTFDYPDAIVPLRRKQDIARSLLEKTRGDLTVALNSKRLEERMEELYRKL